MAVRLDFEIAWDARKVQGLEKGIASLTKETSLFEKAFGKASKTVVHEAALMDASLQKLLSTLKAVSAETRSIHMPASGGGSGGRRTADRAESAMTVAARRTGGRSVSPVSAPDESFLGTLKSASKMNSGGPLFNTAKFLADINALPFGYERYGVRMAKTAELGMTIFAKWGTRITVVGASLAAAAVSAGVLRGTISKLAADGSRDAQRLDAALSRVPGVMDAASSAANALKEAFYGIGNASAWALAEIHKITPGASAGLGLYADLLSAVIPDRSGERAGKKMAAGRRMGDAAESARQKETEHRRELERIKDEEDARVLAEKKKAARNREVMAFADLSGMAAGSDEAKAKSAELAAIKVTIDAINAQEEELHKRRIERAEDEMKKRLETESEVSKLAKKARDEMKNGRQFDIDRVVHAKDLNQQLEIQIQQMEKLAREGKLTDEEKQERQQRIADILARQRQEEAHILELERARSGFALEIAQAQMDAGIDGIQRQAGFVRETIGHENSRLDLLRRTNQISERQYNILKMQLAANPVEIEALKKEQAVEKEKLELARKKAAEDAKNAKTAQERMDAEKEHLRLVGQMQVQEVAHARQRAAAEENVAKAQRDQLAAQQMVKAQREAENAQKLSEQRMGAVQEQMQQQGPNQAAVQRQMFQGRMRSAVAEREKELGRKLNRREQAELYNEQRGQFVRDLRGPSDAQVRRESGRQRGDERRAAREANAANANLPPGLRAAENRFGAGQRANQEAARQEQIRSGAMRQAMMTGINQEQAGAAGEIAKQQIDIMQRQGQLNEAQAELMKAQVETSTMLQQGLAQLTDLVIGLTMNVNGQAKAEDARQQRVRALRAGNPR